MRAPFASFYPTGNREAVTIKVNYRGVGEGIGLAKNRRIAAWASSFDKGRQSTETKIKGNKVSNLQGKKSMHIEQNGRGLE